MVILATHYIAAAGNYNSDDSSILNKDYDEMLLKFISANTINKSFLTKYSGDNISRLSADGGWSKGKLINYYQSDNQVKFGVSASSIYRIDRRIVISGGISYAMDRGRNMAGSAFINPKETPFDIIEATDDNPGTKRNEKYMLDGELGYMFSDRFSMGAMFVYRTENYAKFKDLRHQNTLMNLDLSVGASYGITDLMTLGLAYSYNRNLETVYFKIYGNTDRQYSSLISFGGFYGRKELFGESGYTSDSRPLFTQKHGGALQFLLESNPVNWFNEVYYNTLSGRFGSGASTSITYSNHNGYEAGYKSKVTINGDGRFHSVELNFGYSSLENNENSFKESTDQSGVSQIVYYGSNKVGDRNLFKARLDYQILIGRKENRSDFKVGSSLGFYSRNVTSSLYPYYRKQNINAMDLLLKTSRNLFRDKNVYSISVTAGFSTGWGDMKTDGTYTYVENDKNLPFERNDLLVKEYDYITSSQIISGLSLMYERGLKADISAYTSMDITYRRALNTSMKGFSHSVMGLAVGVKF